MMVRTLWRLATGCYSFKEKVYIEPPSGLERAIAQRKAQ
jgi:hypothetical protein